MKHQQHRLYFLDWVRILAFMLLVVYHVGMYYVSWDWHVKSPFASDAIEPLMLLSSPWRLGLLFLVAGVASRFLIIKLGGLRFLRQRSVRLLVPLIFGMFVIVPPQAYFEVVEKVAYQGGYGDFMRLYVSAYPGFCRAKEGCLDMPTWNHLWFVAYLWVYTLVLGALVLGLGARFERLAQAVTAPLSGWKLIALPAALLALIRLLLLQHFPTTHGLTDDWYNHAQYLTLFVLGAMMALDRPVWARLEAVRWYALAVALTCWAALVSYYSLPEAITMEPALHAWRLLMRAVYALCGWCAIVAVCGFAHRHLNRDNAQRRYLTEAVFPVYILHQSLIVTLAHWLKSAGIAPATEGLMLIVLTLCISFGVFELVRRSALLRPLFGLEWRGWAAQRTTRSDGAAAA
ncbi:MAG: acyltransferase family protein [Pseudomonadota bacterium]